jgi:hypothetical protein
MIKHQSCILMTCAVFLLWGCGNMTPAGPDQHDSKTVELDKSERVHVQLKMNAGELDVRGGSQKLMDADFTYNVAAWKPDIRYSSAGGDGHLYLEQPGPKSSTGNTKNRWDLRLNDSVPIDLTVRLGAGDARLSLGSFNLRDVDFEIGAGDLNLDLRGKPAKDYTVRVTGGAGDATIYLPKDVGISASVTGGLGEISVTGLHKEGDRYINDAWDHAAVRVKLQVTGGVGSVKLIG